MILAFGRRWRTRSHGSNEVPLIGTALVGRNLLGRSRPEAHPTAALTLLQQLVSAPSPSAREVATARRVLRTHPSDDRAIRTLFAQYGRLLLLLARRWAPTMDVEDSHAIAMRAAFEVFAGPTPPGDFVRHLASRVTDALRSEVQRTLTPLSTVGRGHAAVRRAGARAEARPDGLTVAEATVAAIPHMSPGQVEALRQAVAAPVPLDSLGLVACFEDPEDTDTRSAAERLMETALATLPPHEQRLLDAFYGLRGHPQIASAELARLEDVPVATMQKRLMRLRERLKAALVAAKDAEREHVSAGAPFCRVDGTTSPSALYHAERNRRFPRMVAQVADAVVTMAHAHGWGLDGALAAAGRIMALRQRVPDETFVLAVQDEIRARLEPVPASRAAPAPILGDQLAMFAAVDDTMLTPADGDAYVAVPVSQGAT
ncbi:MAG: sigma-70 family RNA polymerase sigma factor [Gemmatimonadaceae bacterium]|nr:sigma-70 family RNA polymerase sigma factor [Gemmatimonadaceae bacterium]